MRPSIVQQPINSENLMSFRTGGLLSQRRWMYRPAKPARDIPEPPAECSVPIDQVPIPTFSQKRVYALQCAVPMIGFGFMDNVIMIQVGDLIDSTLGVTFGFATITAAAMGQVCSDVSGVCFGGFVDALFAKLGLPISDLTPDQLTLASTRTIRTVSMAIGVFSGCLLGMTSLLFMDLEKKERLRKQKELETIFATLAQEGRELGNVERCTLYMIEEDQKHCWSAARNVAKKEDFTKMKKQCKSEIEKAAVNGVVSTKVFADCLKNLGWRDSEITEALAGKTSLTIAETNNMMDMVASDEERIELIEGGTKHWVVTKGKILNVKNIGSDMRFSNSSLKAAASTAGLDTAQSLLIGPVFDDADDEKDRKVVGLVEMVNKRNEKDEVAFFTRDDEKLIRLLCHHCSTFISNAED